MILKKIYISWRSGKGGSRFLVGILSRELPTGDDVIFMYNHEEVEKAKKMGFHNYPEFSDLNKQYSTNLKTILSLRLMPKSRADRADYLSFWKANDEGFDWFDELGFTQGTLATDTFEFLAEFPTKFKGVGINFVSNVASLTHQDIAKGIVKKGDKLRFETDTLNLYDNEAVKLYHNSTLIGYVKRGHNKFFKKVQNNDVDIRVTDFEENGKLKQIYFSVKVLK